ncbi:MAG: hypothetical protein K2W85_11650 [Phycisphaerales bacterium]|nr:hypothetical protein [Phycisphaerales bacterium]
MIRLLRGCWRARWNVLRLLIAAFLLWCVTIDTGARLARLQFAAMPEVDPIPEIARLRNAGRFGESLMLIDAAIDTQPPAVQRDRLIAEREKTTREQESWLRRLRDVGIGAATGGAGSEPGAMSLEMLVGAIATDMLIVGDIRDLVIQSARFVAGDDVDPLIVALSGVGLATTLAPAADWAPAVLKAARRMGAMSASLAETITKAAKSGSTATITRVCEDAGALAKSSSPGAAARLIRLADTPEDLARLSRFVAREGKAGAAALHATQEAGAAAIKHADELRTLGRLDEAASLDALVIKAAAKGERGRSWLRAGAYRTLIKPHPIVGLIKSVYKGHAAAVVQQLLERLDPRAWWLIPLLAAWTLVETGLLLRRLVTSGAHPGNPDQVRATRLHAA